MMKAKMQEPTRKMKEEQPVWKPKRKPKADVDVVAAVDKVVLDVVLAQVAVAPELEDVVLVEQAAVNVVVHPVEQAAEAVALVVDGDNVMMCSFGIADGCHNLYKDTHSSFN